MKFLRTVLSEFIGLFVDDGALAALCAVLIVALTVAVLLASLSGVVAGLLLLTGCVVILVWSVLRAL